MPTGPTHARGRLAPSPTGGLHLGHARTFLAAWLFARRSGGQVVLRIEDLDTARVRPEAARTSQEDLAWLGLTWDEGPDAGGPWGPYVQSDRLREYARALEDLKAGELVYPCVCTRAEVARAAAAPHADEEGPTYPGTCSVHRACDAERFEGRPFAWRFRTPAVPVAWDDLILGRRELDPSRLGGDFIVARQSVGPAYQLAVVVDDAAMKVTQVIRGDDLVPSTPRQVLLYRALGLDVPRFGHLPLVYGPDGRRLAKRDGSVKLATIRKAGVDLRAFVGWLACSLGLADQVEPLSPSGWVERFDPCRIPRVPWTVSAGEIDQLLSGKVPPLVTDRAVNPA